MEVNPNRLNQLRIKRINHSQMPRKHNPELFRLTAILVGACGQIYGIGYNHLDPNSKATIHAERDAINKATEIVVRKYGRSALMKKPIKCELWVIRDNKLNSKPCYNCITECIVNNPYFNIKRIHYSHESSPSGFITVSSNQLFEGRWSYVSTYNLRRMQELGRVIGVDNPMVLARPPTPPQLLPATSLLI